MTEPDFRTVGNIPHFLTFLELDKGLEKDSIQIMKLPPLTKCQHFFFWSLDNSRNPLIYKKKVSRITRAHQQFNILNSYSDDKPEYN